MYLTENQLDSLKELFNIGVGRGASVLNEMLGQHIFLHVPFLKVISTDQLKRELEVLSEDRQAAVSLEFEGDFSGTAELIFPAKSASKLVAILADDDSETLDFDSVRAGTLCEVGNIVLNGVVGSISNLLRLRLSYSIPYYTEKSIENLSSFSDNKCDRVILIARTHFVIRELKIEGNVVLLFEVGTLESLLAAIDNYNAPSMHVRDKQGLRHPL